MQILVTKFCSRNFNCIFCWIFYLSVCCMSYSTIIWNWNKVKSYISGLKPLPRLLNSSKSLLLWDILIFDMSWTSRSTGKCQGSHLWLLKIEGNWRWKRLPDTALSPPYTLQLPLDTLIIPTHSHITLDISQTLLKAAPNTYRPSWHSTDII